MKKDIIPFDTRIENAFYYCHTGTRHYIFQNIIYDNGYSIQKGDNSDWSSFNRDRAFHNDWEYERDRIIRLATPEEIRILKSFDNNGKLLPEPITNYEIY